MEYLCRNPVEMYYLVMVNPYEIRTADMNGEQAEAISLTFFFQEKHDKIDTVYIILVKAFLLKAALTRISTTD